MGDSQGSDYQSSACLWASAIHEIPRIWRVYNRVRGIALPNDQFQFIFDSEAELKTVLEGRAWTFNDWSITLDRWVEKPPADFLQVLPIWIRLRNIPVHFLTKEAIQEIAEHIGTVTHVAFDPLKPLSKGYVLVRILFDVNRPLKNARELQTPTGEVASIGIEYERIRRRCYQCLRLTHDKERCPFNPSNRQVIATGGFKSTTVIPARLIPKISEDDPLYGVLTNKDVGIDFATGKPKTAKEVLDEMQQYLSVADPELKKLHIARVRKSVWDLEGDLQGQKSMLMLETLMEFTADVNKGKGLVFDFEGVGTSSGQDGNGIVAVVAQGKTMTLNSQPMASFSAGSSGTRPNKSKQRRRPRQWKRKAQALKAKDANSQALVPVGDDSVSSKRKAVQEVVWSAKVAKHTRETVVPVEEPPQQR
ncbi:uncharacterized protein LOC111830473 [Capsella rubella]|uniref:uncharacterized protein LOC111830473 n=1 Tax=Capsella rubella TaxID=81985 RepID=UPI000CD52344|nr:uncharacterized protein LOC111830473 [Capsella rubella]